MFEDIYYNDNYDEKYGKYVYLQDELIEDELTEDALINIVLEGALKGFVAYSVTLMLSHILSGDK